MRYILIFNCISVICAAMEAPYILHELAKEYKDPILITIKDLNQSWKLERAALSCCTLLIDQATVYPNSNEYFLLADLNTQDAHLFLSSLNSYSTQSNQHFKNELAQKSMGDIARLAEIADALEAPEIFDSAGTILNDNFNTPEQLKDCLSSGEYACNLNREAAARVAAQNLSQDPSTGWFWALKEHETNTPPSESTFPSWQNLNAGYAIPLNNNQIIDSLGNIWDIQSKSIIKMLPNPPCIDGFNNNLLLCYNKDCYKDHEANLGTFEIYNDQLKLIKTRNFSLTNAETKRMLDIKAAAVERTGKWIVVPDYLDLKKVILINAETQEEKILKNQDHNHFKCLNFSPDGSKLLGTTNTFITILDIQQEKCTQKLTQSPQKESYYLNYAAFNPQGTKVLGVDYNAHVWDVATGALEKTYSHNNGKVIGARYNSIGDLIATTHPKHILIWDAHTHTLLRQLPNYSNYNFKHGYSSWTACFSPDSQYIITSKELEGCPRSLLLHQLYNPATLHYIKTNLTPQTVALLKHIRSQRQENKSADISDHPSIPSLIESLSPQMQIAVKKQLGWQDTYLLKQHNLMQKLKNFVE